ncbi:MAG: hypothetical protein RBR47_13800 [Bacteroidales bacterium]|nr:hypothetical protein [Bacteroidales bacterium]MDY0336021.1 hypothetical protein [Bacteroidales bacterium]NLO51384.1 hypothetical protein [Bacteroidales bacterium]
MSKISAAPSFAQSCKFHCGDVFIRRVPAFQHYEDLTPTPADNREGAPTHKPLLRVISAKK